MAVQRLPEAVVGGWWHDAEGRKKDRNIGELLCLILSRN